ncbi:MAG: capsular biosynthesis protein [Alphaproteobacteria bacterium]|jgi:capsular polysaccharide export protein|nr:capsular biosynthesis protein [Alphaproteobacteria bacterium]
MGTVLPFPQALEKRDQSGHPRVLLLQGPVGPFFARLQKALNTEGWEAWRVAFHAGDALFAGNDRARRVDFPGSPDAWEGWLSALLDRGSVDAMVAFGPERPPHAIARRVAAAHGVPVLCLEAGYIRPGFITAEWGGNNAASPLAGRLPPPGWAPAGPPPDEARDFHRTPWMATWASLYYIAREARSTQVQRALFHRATPLLAEAAGWARNALRRSALWTHDTRRVADLASGRAGPYTLLPLQVPQDANLGAPALGWTSPRLIASAITALAAHGPPDHRLVFKVHPMARGHSTEPALIRSTARALGVEDRVEILETGPLGPLARGAAAMVTVNSTSGLSALHHGTPIVALGRALYTHPALVTCTQGAEPDWPSAFTGRVPVADAALRRRYIAWIREEALIPGDLYAPLGVGIAIRGVAERLSSLSAKKMTSMSAPQMGAGREP